MINKTNLSLTKNINRRQFLQMGSLMLASLAIPSCSNTANSTPIIQPTATAPSQKTILEVGIPQPEFLESHRKIWNVFEAKHPHLKIELFAINEDQFAAYRAKLNNGYLPAIEHTWATALGGVNQHNYQEFMNLSDFDFPWFNRWNYDIKQAWSNLYNLPGPRTLDIFDGFVITWMYQADLMAKSGLDPRRDVKTWDDLKRFLDEGTAWVKTQPNIDYFWDVAYHNLVLYVFYMDAIPMAFPDGGRERQRDCWLGKAKFNAPDSPYRHTFEFFKEAQEKGWTPEGWWTRAWEKDMEASYLSKKSIMMLHGHWPWGKLLAVNPEAQQLGFPATPPATGQDIWQQWKGQVKFDWGYTMRNGVQNLPQWEEIKTAFNWWHSPEAVKLQAEAIGRPVVYTLDEPLNLTGPQWIGVLKDIGGELWPNIVLEDGLTGETAAAPYRKKDSKGVWDWDNDGYYSTWRDFMVGKLTVQEALDQAQANWEASYEGLA